MKQQLQQLLLQLQLLQQQLLQQQQQGGYRYLIVSVVLCSFYKQDSKYLKFIATYNAHTYFDSLYFSKVWSFFVGLSICQFNYLDFVTSTYVWYNNDLFHFCVLLKFHP